MDLDDARADRKHPVFPIQLGVALPDPDGNRTMAPAFPTRSLDYNKCDVVVNCGTRLSDSSLPLPGLEPDSHSRNGLEMQRHAKVGRTVSGRWTRKQRYVNLSYQVNSTTGSTESEAGFDLKNSTEILGWRSESAWRFDPIQ